MKFRMWRTSKSEDKSIVKIQSWTDFVFWMKSHGEGVIVILHPHQDPTGVDGTFEIYDDHRE